jgi:hypothetical protein
MMIKNKNKNNFDEIHTLIRQEEEEAFRIFREGDFNSRLKERIHTEKKKRTPFILWIKEPIFILGVALLIVMAGVIMAMSIFFSSPKEKSGINAIEQFFQSAPGIQSLMKSEVESHGASLKDKGRKAGFLGEEIKKVYLSVHKARQSLAGGEALIWDEKPLPRFDLRQKIEILIKEQKLHDFLTRYLKKNEEDENGPKNFSFDFSVFFLHEPISS